VRILIYISVSGLVIGLCLPMTSCPPPYAPKPPSILSNYRGTYCYVEDDHDPQTKDLDTCQAVNVTFSINGWHMSLDTSRTKESARMACDCGGDYGLENGVQFVLLDSNSTQKVCIYSWLPEGTFQLLRNPSDSCELLLQQGIADVARSMTIYKTLCLQAVR
jgi:hypothetical protein